jgi:hypothetical protein
MTPLNPTQILNNATNARAGDPDAVNALADDAEAMLNLLQAAIQRLKAVTFLVNFHHDNGDGSVPASDLEDALEGHMHVA